eukprot:scaffold158909_cov21-Tisochrysis_lutea.AAC.1
MGCLQVVEFAESHSALFFLLFPSRVHTFEDYWVFERPLYKSWVFRKAGPWGANWRLLAQLDVH